MHILGRWLTTLLSLFAVTVMPRLRHQLWEPSRAIALPLGNHVRRYHLTRCCWLWYALICVLLIIPTGPALAVGLAIIDNPTRMPFGGFASALTTVGDIDGDGITDYLVGAYDYHVQYPPPAPRSLHQGRAFVFSGKTGKELFTLDTPVPMPSAAFGFSVAGAGDVNGDGTPDLLVGAVGYEGSGKAFVFSGKDAALIRTLQAPQRHTGAGFGWAVSSVGDVTGDGTPEILVGAYGEEGTGKVFVFDGRTSKLVRVLAAPPPADGGAFGWSVADAGDLNKDGIADILVGAPYSAGEKTPVQGRAYAFSGKDGKLLLTLDDPRPHMGAVFGWRVLSAGDTNKDGVPDILVSAPYKDIGNIAAQGEAFVFSGTDGTVLYTLKHPVPKPYGCFGYTIARGPDVDGDGAPELLVSAPFQSVDQFHVQGEVFIFNGRDGRHLMTFDDPYPHQGAAFGYTIASPGDVTGDKFPDFAFGASGQAVMDKVAVGRIFVFLSQQ